MISLPKVILYLRPNSKWSLKNNDYSTLNWEGPGNKPTEQEINDAWSDAEIYWSRKTASLSKADFKLGLLSMGELQRVKDFIAQTGDERIVILWEDSDKFERLNKDLLEMSSQLGYTDAQLDELFGIN